MLENSPFALIKWPGLQEAANSEDATEIVIRAGGVSKVFDDSWANYISPKISVASVKPKKDRTGMLCSDGSVWSKADGWLIPPCVPIWAKDRIANHISDEIWASRNPKEGIWTVAMSVNDAVALSKRIMSWISGFHNALVDIVEEEI